MDCEKFDRVVLDLLYDELDELTRAAARRHMDHCARCGPIANGLRATREVGVMPIVLPPADLEHRILEAEKRLRARLPWRQRVGRAVSVVAGYTMRPQLAMVALLLLMIGSSLLVLRSHPSERDEARVKETGVPEIEGETTPAPVAQQRGQAGPAAPWGRDFGAVSTASNSVGLAPVYEASRMSARPEQLKAKGAAESDTVDGYDQAMNAYRKGDYAEAQRRFSAVASTESPNAPSAALLSAQATREGSGCATALPRFEEVALRYSGSSVGYDAAWQGANCHRDLGQRERAERAYRALLRVPGYEQRAADGLASLATEQPVALNQRRAAPAKPASKDASRAKKSVQAAEPASASASK